jgi:hypothetical protein
LTSQTAPSCSRASVWRRRSVRIAFLTALFVGAVPGTALANSVIAKTPTVNTMSALDSDGQTHFGVVAQAKFSSVPPTAEVVFIVDGPAAVDHGLVDLPGQLNVRHSERGVCHAAGVITITTIWSDPSLGLAQDQAVTSFECRDPVTMLWGKPWKTRAAQAGAVLGIAGGIICAVTGPPGWALAGAVLGITGGGIALAVSDPPDAAYTTVVQVVPYTPVVLTTADGFTAGAVPILNGLLQAHARVREQSVALAQALDRWQGAVNAGDLQWQDTQAIAATAFAHSLAQRLRELADIQDGLSAALTGAGESDVAFSPATLQTAVENWLDQGPTPTVATALDSAGWSAPIAGYPDDTMLHWSQVQLGLAADADLPGSLFAALSAGSADERASADELDAWAPAVTSIDPATGPEAGGTPVTVHGQNLAAITEVDFGSVPVTGVTCTATDCTLVAPPGVGVADIVARTSDGPSAPNPSAQFTYVPPAGNLLANGGLEGGGGFPSTQDFLTIDPGQFGPWEVVGNAIDVVGPNQAVAAAGRQFIDLNGNRDATSGPAAIRQTVTTIPGHSYTLTFAVAGNPNGDPVVKRVRASLGALVSDYDFDTTGHANDALGWAHEVLTATACGPTVTVELRSLTAGMRGPNIDDIALTDDGLAAGDPCSSTPGTPKVAGADLAVTTSASFSVQWTVPATSGDTISYLIQRAVKKPGSPLGAYADWGTCRLTASTTMTGAKPGYSYCFRVQALNSAGHASPWSAPHCLTLPTDDRTLAAHGAWTRVKSPRAYRHTASTSHTRGARLVLAKASGRALALLVTKLPGGGVLGVYVNGKRVAQIRTAARRTTQATVLLHVRTTGRSLELRVEKPGLRGVTIDGIAQLP